MLVMRIVFEDVMRNNKKSYYFQTNIINKFYSTTGANGCKALVSGANACVDS